MNILLNGQAIPAPDDISFKWESDAGSKPLVTLTIQYNSARAQIAKSVLAPGLNKPLNVTCVNPATGMNMVFPAICLFARAQVLRQYQGEITYAPISLTLKEVISP